MNMFVISKKITIFASNYNGIKDKRRENYAFILLAANPLKMSLRRRLKSKN